VLQSRLPELHLGLTAATAPSAPSADQMPGPARSTPDNASASAPSDGLVSILRGVAGAASPYRWSWACCGRLGASGLALAILEAWQIAGLVLTRPASGASGTGFLAFWGGVASVLGLDFAPMLRWGQAPVLFALVAIAILAVAFVLTAEFCI